MKVKAITAKQAKKLSLEIGVCFGGEMDGRTFYATNEEETELWEFDTRRERDSFIKGHEI